MRMPFIATLTVFLLLPLTCLAVPTGLNMMPTAESLGMAETRVEVESAGGGKMYVPRGDTLYGSQVGALLGVEAGIDQVSGPGTRYNAKWVFKGDGLILPALAVGVQNVSSNTKSDVYAVATKSLVPGGLVKLHAGVMRSEGEDYTMLGASFRLGPIQVKADQINGGLSGNLHQGQSYSAGASVGNITLTGTHYDYETGSDKNTVTVSYSYKPL